MSNLKLKLLTATSYLLVISVSGQISPELLRKFIADNALNVKNYNSVKDFYTNTNYKTAWIQQENTANRAYFTNVLKLPEYLLVFTGVLKLAGLVVLYIPRFPKLKEWVFAGFTIDFAGAWYCNVTAANSFAAGIPVIIYLMVLMVLYYLYGKKNLANV